MDPDRRQVLVRRLRPGDAPDFMSLRRAALEEAPFAFSSSPEDDRAREVEFVRDALGSSDQAVFGAFGTGLVGIVGIYRDRGAKGAHKCSIWGLYVVPEVRSRGVARALVTEALRFARSLEGVTHVFVSATENAPQAKALYESLGFVTWGVEPEAVRIGDIAVSEHHLVRRLGCGEGVRVVSGADPARVGGLDFCFRVLGPGDASSLEAMATMFGEAFEDEETYSGARPSPAYLERLLASSSFIAIAALAGAQVVGGLTAYELQKPEQERSEIYLYDLAVAETHRRRGVATALIGELKKIAAARRAWVIFVQADLGDDPAIALYAKLGTREDVVHFDIPPAGNA